ncbi:MAG: PTS system mannose/fructose/sorbose family transporter subunit IID, partial [Gemmatimonadota bacterium]
METLPRRTRLAVLARSLAIQGSWNYRTLLGTGFAFALIPALRRIHAMDEPGELEEAVRRHGRVFNSHPYLSPVALGAVARLEAEGADPAMIERFKSAVRGALGSLGDRLVWTGWRPVCVLLGLTVWLAGAPAWAAAAIFLAVYNIGHVALRAWALHVGLRDGVRVAGRFRGSRIERVEHALAPAGAFLVGVSIPLVARGGGALATGTPLGPGGLA